MAVWSIISKPSLEGATRIDAEYYQPFFIKQIAKIKSHSVLRLEKIAKSIKKGIFDIKAETYLSKGIPFVRISNLKNGLIDSTGLVCISPDMNAREKKTSLSNRDIVLSKTAYPAASMITFNKCNISQDIIGIRIKKDVLEKVIPGYVVVFLNTTYGLNQMERWFQGNIQRHLALPDAKEIMIPLAGIEFQKDVEKILLNVEELQKSSVRLYTQAEQMLLEELGMKDLDLSHELFCTTNLNDTKQVRRIDAEYYQPKYDNIIERIKRHHSGFCILTEKVKNIDSKTNPSKTPDKEFKYIELENINPGIGVVDSHNLIIGKDAPSRAQRVVKTNDVIVSSIKGALDKTALVPEEYNNSLASTGFFLLRSDYYQPACLLALMKSNIIQEQLDRETSGAILSAMPKKSLNRICLPLLDKRVQTKVSDLIIQSHQARQRAKELLAQAKKQVEDLIEKGGIKC